MCLIEKRTITIWLFHEYRGIYHFARACGWCIIYFQEVYYINSFQLWEVGFSMVVLLVLWKWYTKWGYQGSIKSREPFHQYQPSEQAHLTSLNFKNTTTYNVGNPDPGLGQAPKMWRLMDPKTMLYSLYLTTTPSAVFIICIRIFHYTAKGSILVCLNFNVLFFFTIE